MAAIYLTSNSAEAGKTMLGSGLLKIWQTAGRRVGYLKLLDSEQALQSDPDSAFMQNLLGLKEALEQIRVPINPKDAGASINQALGRMASEKDLVMIEGLGLKESQPFLAAVEARVLVLHDYALPFKNWLPEYQKLGRRCLGVILNKVPRSLLSRYQAESRFEAAKLKVEVLGVIPEDRFLMSISIGELARAVQGKINNSEEKAGELVENLIVGASTFDRGPAYYNRKMNKGVILWGERPGVRKAALAGYQIAALGTSTRCIVLSANTAPAANVLEQATAKGIPLISAPGDVTSIISALDASMAKAKFGQEKKMAKLVDVLQQNLSPDHLAEAAIAAV